MAGSPRYLDLLERIPETSPDTTDLATAWKHLAEGSSIAREYNLWQLAQTVFYHLAEAQDLPLAVVLADAADLHVRKNAGYAGAANADPWANFRLSEAFGVTPIDGVLVRMSDKWSRILSLEADPNNDQVGESILDTKRDLGAYALIGLCLIEEYD